MMLQHFQHVQRLSESPIPIELKPRRPPSHTSKARAQLHDLARRLGPGEGVTVNPSGDLAGARVGAERALWRCRKFFLQITDCTITDSSGMGHLCHSIMLYNCVNLVPILERLHSMDQGIQEAPGVQVEKFCDGSLLIRVRGRLMED